jgi:Trk-type K+ transport system membrane component
MRAASVPPPEPPEARRGGSLHEVTTAAPAVPGADSGGNGPATTVALDILRSLADQEVERAETARTRSRQGFALAVGVFAVVQTVAYGQFVTKLATQGHRTGTLINHTAWAAVGLAASALFLLAAELPLGSQNVRPSKVRDLASGSSANALSELIQDYYLIVESHREANKKRFVLVLLSQLAALATVGLVVWELIIALHASL